MILQYDSTNPEKGYNVVLPADGKDLRHYSVYTLHSPEGKIYAGYTGMPLTKRWKNGNGYKKNNTLWDDIEYYGWDNFDKTANGEHMDIITARNFEYYLIRRYDLTNPEKGYNQNYGGFSARAGLNQSLYGVWRPELSIPESVRPQEQSDSGIRISLQHATGKPKPPADFTGNWWKKKRRMIPVKMKNNSET